jgi:hypothetical protein
MKQLILIFITLMLFSCSKEQEKLELFSEEAFAFYLEESWELNASARVKGFTQLESEEYLLKSGTKILDTDDGAVILDDKVKEKVLTDVYTAKISYSIDLITPPGDTLSNVDYGLIDKISEEEMMDLPVETQIEMDSSFAVGKYKIVFIVDDNLSQRSVSSEKEFSLSKE